MTMRPSASDSELTPVKFSRLSHRGVLLGLSGLQLVVASTGAFALVVGLYLGIILLALPVIGLCAALAFASVGGRRLIEWGPIAVRWLWRAAGGQLVYRRRIVRPRPAGTLALPGDAASLRQWADA